MPTKDDAEQAFEAVFDLYKSKAYQVKITSYRFDDALNAYEDVLSGNTIGKLVVNIIGQ
jgi:D-arabinose 1-dehydrogenase-like Zn-dependent alcohol dehydrogenase